MFCGQQSVSLKHVFNKLYGALHILFIYIEAQKVSVTGVNMIIIAGILMKLL